MTSDQSLAGSYPLRIEKTIHNIVYTIKWTQVTLQATSLNIHGFTTSDQSLAGSHTLWIKGQKANKKLKSFGIKAVTLPQVVVAPLR